MLKPRGIEGKGLALWNFPNTKIDLGISLGANHGMENEPRLSSLDIHESSGYRKSYRTLIMMQRLKFHVLIYVAPSLPFISWLKATSDYSPGKPLVIPPTVSRLILFAILGQKILADCIRFVLFLKMRYLESRQSSRT